MVCVKGRVFYDNHFKEFISLLMMIKYGLKKKVGYFCVLTTNFVDNWAHNLRIYSCFIGKQLCANQLF